MSPTKERNKSRLDWSLGSPMVHEITGNNPNAWYSWVETLTRAANRVREDDTQLPSLPGGEEGMFAINAVYAMLLGYAIECALKGLWVAAGNKIVENGQYSGVRNIGPHELGKLARVVTALPVAVRVSAAELNVLDRLSAFILFAGRYPISKKPEAMAPIKVPGRGKQVPHVFLREDFRITRLMLNRFSTALNPHINWKTRRESPPTDV
jgi:hypothetical protein